MILGIGTDIALISRLEQTRQAQGARFLERCFTAAEAAYIQNTQNPRLAAARLAKRWAAKEACAKALGSGISGNIHLKDIEVRKDDNGRPFLVLHGGARAALDLLAGGAGQGIAHVSLSDDGDIAQAFVVLSRKNA